MFHPYWQTVARIDRVTGERIAEDQKLSREEALRALTMGGAYLCMSEADRGSLEVGKLADFAVLDGLLARASPSGSFLAARALNATMAHDPRYVEHYLPAAAIVFGEILEATVHVHVMARIGGQPKHTMFARLTN